MWRSLPHRDRSRIRGLAFWIAVVTIAFAQPLIRLVLYTAQSPLDSYILLVPFVAGYFLYLQRGTCPAAYRSSVTGTVIVGSIGLIALIARIALRERLSVNDDLTLMALAYVNFVATGGFLLLGSKWMTASSVR